jgi:hypothetical protein
MSLHFCTGVLNCLYVSLNLCNVCSTTVSWIVFKCLYMSARVRLELSWYVCNGNETCMLIIRMNCFEVCMRQRMLSISYVHLLGIYALWRTFAALWLCWVEECWDFSIITNTPRKFPPFLIWLRVGLMTIQCGPPSFKSPANLCQLGNWLRSHHQEEKLIKQKLKRTCMSCAAIHDRMVPDVKAPCTCRVQVNKYTIAWYLTLRTPFNDVEGLKTTVSNTNQTIFKAL